MRAVIMAGGKGTRLAPLNTRIPKPMFPVLGKPILEYQVESLKRSGIDDITIIVGHLKEEIMNYFEDGRKFGVKIGYIEENKPLGTAGALYYLKEEPEDFFLIFGDLILDIDFRRFMEYHKAHSASVTLFGHPNSHPYDSDVIEVDRTGRVTRILNKNVTRNYCYYNFVNAGVYCINPKVIENMKQPDKIDLEKTLIARLISQASVYAYKSTEYVKDMGTPERLERVAEDIQKGIVSGKSLRQKQQAVFLNQDWAINEHAEFLGMDDQFNLLTGMSKAIRQINDSKYLAIVIVKQSSRDKVACRNLNETYKKMETKLGKEGAYFDDTFFCPYRPYRDHNDEAAKFRIRCGCGRLKNAVFNEVAEKHNIDLEASWYISDNMMDIQTGKSAGMRTILIRTGEGVEERKNTMFPEYVVKDLLGAVEYIFHWDMKRERSKMTGGFNSELYK